MRIPARRAPAKRLPICSLFAGLANDRSLPSPADFLATYPPGFPDRQPINPNCFVYERTVAAGKPGVCRRLEHDRAERNVPGARIMRSNKDLGHFSTDTVQDAKWSRPASGKQRAAARG
jgi:hypothetical protein